METVDKSAYNDESFYLDGSDCKNSQEMEQYEDTKIPIFTSSDCKKSQEREQYDNAKISSDPESYENIVKNIKKAGEHGHESILHYLNQINFGIGDYVQKEGTTLCVGKKVTIFKIILENVSNGHDLILQILDSLVKKIPPKKCSKCFDSKKDPDAKIEIDLEPIFQRADRSTDSTNSEFNRSKMRLIRDLLDVQSKRGDDNNINQIFQHPVIEILILKKWQIHQWSYIGKVRFFALVVFLFTFFVRLRLLEEDETRCINAFNGTVNEDGNTTNKTDCEDYLEDPNDWTSEWMNSIDETTRPFNRLLIFKYKETSFTIFAVGMGLVVFTQLCYFFRELFEACKQKTRPSHRRRIIKFLRYNFANMFYLLVVTSLVCISSPIPTLKCYILLCWLVIVLGEIRQLCCLVFRPAWQGFNLDFLKPVFQHRYFRDPENYLELFCIISIPIAIYSNAWARNPQDEHDENDYTLETEAVFRGVVAIGVFAAWTELFIKLGNVSHSVVGDFTKMFYNIIKTKLLAYMQVCILLIVAFSLAFWIILEGNLKEDGEDFSKGFWFNLVLTVTMSTGEFNTGDFYKNIAENGVIKVFAMLFLIGLVILSTITMINLLVAAIISDYEKMKISVDMENLCFITEYIIEEGEYQRLIYQMGKRNTIAKKFYDFFVKEDVETTIFHCPHLNCNRDVCVFEPIPIAKPGWSYNQAAREREPLLLRILEIRKGKEKGKDKTKKENEDEDGDENEEFCNYHKYGLTWSRYKSGDMITYRADNRTSLEMKTNSTNSLSTASLEMKNNGTIAIAITPSAM